MRVLQLCHKIPFPVTDGGAHVIHSTTLGLLEYNTDLKVLAINPSRQGTDLSLLSEDYKRVTKFEAINVDTGIRVVDVLVNFFRRESYFTERFNSAEFENKLKETLFAEQFDIVQLEHLYMCKFIHVIRKYSSAKIILRPQNVEYVIWERYMKGISNLAEKFILNIAINRLRKFEAGICREIDGIVPLTKEDAEIFASFNSGLPLQIVPMGYNHQNLDNYNFKRQYDSAPVVYHLGSMDWRPNEEAIKWFLEKVVPLLPKDNSIKIVIAGNKMPPWVFGYSSDVIQVRGRIEDPLKFQEDKPIMIVPLLSGSGIRVKIIEGLALGKTIISTSVGAQGISYENNRNLIIADTPEDFAAKIVTYCSDKKSCRMVGENALKLSAEKYNYRMTAGKMMAFYDEVLNSS